MFSEKFYGIAIGGSLLLALSGFVIGTLFPEAAEPVLEVFVPGESTTPVYESGWYDADYYDRVYALVGDVDRTYADSAIVAHHYVVAEKIAEVFLSIGAKNTDTVILLSPNHFSVGAQPVQISFGTWNTPYGELETDISLAEELLLDLDIARNEEHTFETEHGVSLITPFIKRSFPNAEFVPIVIHDELAEADVHALAAAIQQHAPSAKVIASIDMSHTLPVLAANFHDAVTLRDIAMNGSEDLDLEIDANRVLDTLQRINALRGTREFTMTHHGSSLEMGLTDLSEENTSHILGYFTEGMARSSPFASFQIVGDIMLDRGVRTKIETEGVEYPWEMVKRFLQGTHLRIGNLEGTVNERESKYTDEPPFEFVFDPMYVEAMRPYIDVVSLANNHSSDVGSAGEVETQEWLDDLGVGWFGGYLEPQPRYDTDVNGIAISVIGYHAFQPATLQLTDQIVEAKEEGRFVIVMPHWGTEYTVQPSSWQRELAEGMVEAGADLIVGGHPHVVQGIEIMDGVPVVYSLGNFVFDQILPETRDGLSLGVIIDETEIVLYLLPVHAYGGQPYPLPGDAAAGVLQMIQEASPEELQNSILEGVLRVPRL